jgi:ribonuclease HI
MIHIFTDGSCPSNGKGAAAKAAYATILWNLPGSAGPIEIAEVVPKTEPQTNQRAELRAVHRAFEEIQIRKIQDKPIVIWTDSDYVRRCITEWAPLWKARGWRKTQCSKPIEHLDLLKPMIAFYEAHKETLQIRHVEAHTKKTEFPYDGNAAADKLAFVTATNISKESIP